MKGKKHFSKTAKQPVNIGIRRILMAAVYSLKGFRVAFMSEVAIRQEVCITLLLVPITLFLDVTDLERVLLISSLILVIIVELLNSAIEATIDRIGTEVHELSAKAKDMGSAAVFVSLCLAGFIWLVIGVF